ncbi:AaceriAER284Wp [[Ashbya] aceris (nom. inval.)]|nr:AaceriAER284Wp [[Ashbya] aceris (nom. inval.)]
MMNSSSDVADSELYVSFTAVYGFIRSVTNNDRPNENASTWELIAQFLKDNKSLLVNVSEFSNTQGTVELPRKMALRGSTYEASSEDIKEAVALSEKLHVNPQECLRVIVQCNLRLQPKEERRVLYAQNILQERNSVLDTILVLLNNDNVAQISKIYLDLFVQKKTTIVGDLISLLSTICAELASMEPSTEDVSISQFRYSHDISYLLNILRLLSILCLNSELPVPIIESWVDFLDETECGVSGFWQKNLPEEVSLRLQSLVVIVSILMFGLGTAHHNINVSAPFFNSEQIFIKVNKLLLRPSSNPVILYYWSFVLSVKAYLLEEAPETNVDFAKNVFGTTAIDDLINAFTARAESLHVLDGICRLHKTLSDEGLYSAIMCSFLILSLNFISLNEETTHAIKLILTGMPKDLIESFLTSPELEKKLSILRAKLPLLHESLIPMINLTSIHPEFAHFEWKELPTYAQKLKLNDIDYDLSVDDDNRVESTDLIVLKNELLVKPPMEFEENVLLPIAKDTKGQIIPSAAGDEDIVVFLYKYSGWALIGRILQNICETYRDTCDPMTARLRQYLLVSILDLISSIVDADTPLERSTEILQHISGYVTEDDIFSLIFKTFEQALHSRDMEVLVPCLKLFSSMVTNFPHIVWSHLSRSDLIDRHGKAGMVTTLIGALELPNGEYLFTIAFIKLADELVSESLHVETAFPERMKRELLGRIVKQLLHVYESYQYWKYSNINQRFEIGALLTSLFTKIIYSVYGIDQDSKPGDKITRVLADAASFIVTVFIGTDSPDIRAVNSLVSVLVSPTTLEAISLNHGVYGAQYNKLLQKSFAFGNMLVSVRGLLKLPPTTLEKSIYSKATDLVNAYIYKPSLKVHVIKLFTYLVRAPWFAERPSLLAHLGHDHAKSLLELLTFDLSSPIQDYRVLKNIYSFFSSIMEGKQDGMSILFLTGNIVTFDDSKHENKEVGSKSILTILKRNALNLDRMPEDLGSHLLDAISYAFNSWTSARNYAADKDFITALVKRLEAFEPNADNNIKSIEQVASMASKYRLISRIAEICALYLFTSTGTSSPIFDLLGRNDLATIVNPLFELDGYNKDLHTNLAVNFEKQWPGLSLSTFSLSTLVRDSNSFQTIIYDLPLMDQYFSGDEAWFGSETQTGLREQVVEASINIQFVTYQISAAKSWGALLTSFIKKTPVPLQDTFVDIVLHLLKVNIEKSIESPFFVDIYLERIELCFYVLYSFMKTSKNVAEKKLVEITSHLMKILTSPEIDFLGNIASSRKSAYYRPLLRSILIALSLVNTGTHFIELISVELLEFFERIFCKGVNLILSEILSEINTTSSCGNNVSITSVTDKIQDLLLLLSLFTSIKNLQPPKSFMLMIATSLNEVDTVKALLNLYSSSHLFRVNEEPIIADITLIFLCEFCSVDEVAEKLIINGLFSVLLESPISIMIQQGGIKPEIQPRLHSIWSNGLLSIILQLLSQFGAQVLPECCLFVTYFSKQLSSTIFSWSDNSLAISNSIIQDTSQIIMLQKMFSALEYQKYLSNSNAKTKVIDDVDVIEIIPGLDTEMERKELYRSFTHLLTHPKYLNSRIVPTTLEEQRLLQDEETRAVFVKNTTEEIRKLQDSLFSDF